MVEGAADPHPPEPAMSEVPAADVPLDIGLSGYALINTPMLNKGTAFTNTERDSFRLHGLLPPHVGSLEE
jgi:malate dehydrogenase (oxaloacetate-decarboxylating)